MGNAGSPDSKGRAPNERVEVTLEIQSVGELYSDVAPRLSGDGIFIEVDNPAPPESEVGFRVVLPDGVVLIRGHGTVMWARFPPLGEGPPGMAVRFVELDPEMRETIEAVIDAHLAAGGDLFDLDGEEGGDTFPTDSLTGQTPDGGVVRWKWDGETPSEPAADSGEVGEDTDVVDLKFEEAIAAFSEPQEPPDSSEDRAIDEAISAAVSLPATPEADTAGGPEGEVESAGDPEDASGHPIPDVLDQWRDELEVASRRPEPQQPAPDTAPGTARWESLLPFEADDHDMTGPGALDKPRQTVSSARRGDALGSGPNRWWLALPVLAVVVVAVAILVWVGENGRGQGPAGDPMASLEAAAEAAADRTAPENLPDAVESEPMSAAPAPEPTVRPQPTSAARRVESITWNSGSGETEIVIRGDGLFRPERVDASRLGSPTRVLVRLRGITTPFGTRRFDVGSSEVTAVRVGHHPELKPPTLYVVLDLASPSVVSTDGLTIDGDVARMRVRTR